MVYCIKLGGKGGKNEVYVKLKLFSCFLATTVYDYSCLPPASVFLTPSLEN